MTESTDPVIVPPTEDVITSVPADDGSQQVVGDDEDFVGLG